MMEMAKAHDLNIYNYLNHLPGHLPGTRMTDSELSRLTPWNPGVSSGRPGAIQCNILAVSAFYYAGTVLFWPSVGLLSAYIPSDRVSDDSLSKYCQEIRYVSTDLHRLPVRFTLLSMPVFRSTSEHFRNSKQENGKCVNKQQRLNVKAGHMAL